LLIEGACRAETWFYDAPTRSGETTRRSNPMKARMYRLALVAGVVAVFLEGLGAGLKWG